MIDVKNKSQEELMEIRRNATPGGETFEHLTKEIDGIRQDTNNRQIASLITEVRNFTTEVKKYTETTERSNRKTFRLTIFLVVAAAIQAFSAWSDWQIAENAIDIERDANSLEYARWQYEMTRNNRLESREIEWRKQDLQLEGG